LFQYEQWKAELAEESDNLAILKLRPRQPTYTAIDKFIQFLHVTFERFQMLHENLSMINNMFFSTSLIETTELCKTYDLITPDLTKHIIYMAEEALWQLDWVSWCKCKNMNSFINYPLNLDHHSFGAPIQHLRILQYAI
jgi:hypothetical protein